jgi:hypothetical protein
VKIMTGTNKCKHYVCSFFWGGRGVCSEMETFFNDLRIKYVGLTGYILKMNLTWPVLDSFIIPEASSRIFRSFSVSQKVWV